MLQSYLQSIAQLDVTVLERASSAPSDLTGAVETYWEQMQERSKDLAAHLLGRMNTSETTQALLKLYTKTDSGDVRATIMLGLREAKTLPNGDRTLRLLEIEDSPGFRSMIYLLAAKGGAGLDAVRNFGEKEEDETVQLSALVAAAMLQGTKEKRLLYERIRDCNEDDVLELLRIVPPVRDRLLARGVIRWLADDSPITRLIGDDAPDMLRKQDAAVILAVKLGVEIPGGQDRFQNFPPIVLAKAKEILSQLPEIPKEG